MMKLRMIILALLTIFPLLNSACGAPAPSPSSLQIIEISAAQLYAEYKANEIAADLKYKDKTLRVTGIINSIGKDISGSPYVTLTSGGEYDMWGVQIIFSSSYEPQIAKLVTGQQLTATGRCKGCLLNVLMRVD